MATAHPLSSELATTTSQSDGTGPGSRANGGGHSGGQNHAAGSRCDWAAYEQILANNAGHSMPSNVWAEALLEIETHGCQSHTQLLSLYRRALSSCPYSMRLWCQMVDCQTRAGDPWDAVKDTCEAALNSGMHRADDLRALRAKMKETAAVYQSRLLS